VLLVGLGAADKFDRAAFRKAQASAAKALIGAKVDNAASYLADIACTENDDVSWRVRTAGEEVLAAAYRFDQYKSKKDDKPAKQLEKFTLASLSKSNVEAAEVGLARAVAVDAGRSLARDLGNTPPNVCNPSYLADQAAELKKQFKSLKVEVLSEAQMEKLGMGSLLSVSRGSDQPGKLIAIQHSGGKKGDAPVVFIGKGVTFDTGGISLKPGLNMDEMKYDMCGAASVFGVLRAVAELELPINVVGVVPAVENMPGGGATRPGDIVTSMSGQTIEILNTDAEGRLILCDALTWAGKFKPDVVVDIATLTGACIVALGHETAAVLGNDDALIGALRAAGDTSGDSCWQLPMNDAYDKGLDSPFADMANIGGRAGTITAACFLGRFTKEYRWAHLDIAGVAWKSGAEKNATGRPVPMLMQYLFDRVDN
jgi:leucyl aminopeptidase